MARREEEQRAEEEFVNAERIRLDQVKRERESDRIRIEAEDAEEQRQLMLAISAEKSRREEDRLRLLETARLEREREAEEELIRQREREVQQERETVVDDASSEMARKAEVQRLKREAFLKDMNAFSQTIEEEAERAASGRRAAEERSSGQYARSTVPISTSVNPFDESPPQFNYETENNSDSENVERSEERTEERTARFEDEEVPGSFNELTSSLFAANASTSNSVKNRNTENNKLNDENIFGESEDYSRISRAGNLAASQINGNKRNIHSQNNENTNMSREGMRTESPPHDDEEEEGMGGASSISNILTIDERKILSPQQKVAWRALQADLTTRRKGVYIADYLS